MSRKLNKSTVEKKQMEIDFDSSHQSKSGKVISLQEYNRQKHKEKIIEKIIKNGKSF